MCAFDIRTTGLSLLLVFISLTAWTQQPDSVSISVYAEEDQYEDDPYFWSNTKETGLNITPLISRFVPFNLGERQPGVLGLQWKRYYSTRAFRFGFGADIGNDLNDQKENFLYLSVGLEKRHAISRDKKWTYASSWDLILQAGESEESFIAGIGKGYSIEYHFTKRLFVSTQAQLIAGTDTSGLRILFQMPTDLYFHVRLY
jgi:hypothetical protein